MLDKEGLELCKKCIASVPFKNVDLLYARVDLIRDNNAKWVVTEMECIEPSLFFRHNAQTGDQFSHAVEWLMQQPKRPVTPRSVAEVKT